MYLIMNLILRYLLIGSIITISLGFVFTHFIFDFFDTEYNNRIFHEMHQGNYKITNEDLKEYYEKWLEQQKKSINETHSILNKKWNTYSIQKNNGVSRDLDRPSCMKYTWLINKAEYFNLSIADNLTTDFLKKTDCIDAFKERYEKSMKTAKNGALGYYDDAYFNLERYIKFSKVANITIDSKYEKIFNDLGKTESTRYVESMTIKEVSDYLNKSYSYNGAESDFLMIFDDETSSIIKWADRIDHKLGNK